MSNRNLSRLPLALSRAWLDLVSSGDLKSGRDEKRKVHDTVKHRDNSGMNRAPLEIAILFHKNHQERQLSRYAVTFLAEFWRQDGNRVRYLFGPGKFVPADLLLIHVDLSVVPAEYLEFASRYPIALNKSVKDIRKSLVSTNLVRSGDSYSGKVIVKSDLNHGGGPERILRSYPSSVDVDDSSFRTPFDYRIYDSLRDVPRADFERKEIVVEKFLPEKEENFFFVRHYEFLGDRSTCTRLASLDPIVQDRTVIRVEEIDPNPEIVQARKRLNFDYGKFDYVVHNGRVVLLDANKTTGADRVVSPALNARRRHRANGIYSYFGSI